MIEVILKSFSKFIQKKNKDASFDRAPVQKEATFYTPLKFSQTMTFLGGDVEYSSGKTETITLKYTVDGKESSATFDAILFKTHTYKLSGASPQRDCDSAGGHFNVKSTECSVYYALE